MGGPLTKNILIIGSSGDIGKSIANKMAADGYQLILHYYTNEKAILKLSEELPEESILALIQANLETNAGIEKLLEEVVFPVDGVIFTSGRACFGLFQYATDATMEAMLMQHVKAPWKITQALLPMMLQKQAGKIIFITSIWAERGAGNEVIYSAVKGSQNSFIKALAKEAAASGVHVNGISAGFISTKMNAHLSSAEQQDVMDQIPMQRAGTPEEIADTVLFLMDDRTTYIQGEIINVNGGW